MKSLIYRIPRPISSMSIDGRMTWPCADCLGDALTIFFPENCDFDGPRLWASNTFICERVSL